MKAPYLWLLIAEDGQRLFQNAGAPGDIRNLVHALETATGMRWSRFKISTSGARFKHEHAVNRALAYGGMKVRSAAA
jgi:hypothetical protein